MPNETHIFIRIFWPTVSKGEWDFLILTHHEQSPIKKSPSLFVIQTYGKNYNEITRVVSKTR